MPYVSKRIWAIAAIAYVIRIDGCDKAAAMRQIETAALDGALRWVGRGSNRRDWDVEVFRTDSRELLPMDPPNGIYRCCLGKLLRT